ncbi:MAG: MBL fold metallo-hydrolase [Nitrospinaceae bacterium]|nr:MBL fold metallo-hydrolase [Nitrospinaceae bacterium]NIR53620.1 MBL fold metallo-hydrolase [Nitrospinaceae bacterium]NIS84023.1 MBL fold metallo-hydrolase [Nitrospinaceae bacterium]NIT85317.1 MBL fold metallo-hydrolase [Nitrospinaceae bacterium]NIU43136.1 MBL fold metallo-hydrolase [Nitrospinaceae bacterium]
MTNSSPLYFKQLLCGVDVGRQDSSARSMANFIYLLGDRETRECVVVDPAWDIDGLLEIVAAEDMKLTGALVTHYHPDHVGGHIFGMDILGLPHLMEKNPVPIYVNKNEAEGLRKVTGVSLSDMKQVDSEERMKVGSIEISFLHTPGHTPGSQCFRVKDSLVAGDTLFLQGCGRVDLPGGNSEEMYHTLTRRLAKIQDDVILYPGHNYGGSGSAPLGEVRETNSYLQISSLAEWRMMMG